jgi:hypothetical protein
VTCSFRISREKNKLDVCPLNKKKKQARARGFGLKSPHTWVVPSRGPVQWAINQSCRAFFSNNSSSKVNIRRDNSIGSLSISIQSIFGALLSQGIKMH